MLEKNGVPMQFFSKELRTVFIRLRAQSRIRTHPVGRPASNRRSYPILGNPGLQIKGEGDGKETGSEKNEALGFRGCSSPKKPEVHKRSTRSR